MRPKKRKRRKKQPAGKDFVVWQNSRLNQLAEWLRSGPRVATSKGGRPHRCAAACGMFDPPSRHVPNAPDILSQRDVHALVSMAFCRDAQVSGSCSPTLQAGHGARPTTLSYDVTGTRTRRTGVRTATASSSWTSATRPSVSSTRAAVRSRPPCRRCCLLYSA